MASLNNMKFWHVIVMQGYKTVFDKKCLDIKEANTVFEEKKKEYQGQPEFNVSKENY